jgi:hypothetical protein
VLLQLSSALLHPSNFANVLQSGVPNKDRKDMMFLELETKEFISPQSVLKWCLNCRR